MAEMKDVSGSILLLTIRLAKMNGRLLETEETLADMLHEAKKIKRELRKLIKMANRMTERPGSGGTERNE